MRFIHPPYFFELTHYTEYSTLMCMLHVCRESKALGVLDLDVTPTVCIDRELGTFDELLE